MTKHILGSANLLAKKKTLLSVLLGSAIALAGCGGGGGTATATSIAGSLGAVDSSTLTSFGVDAGGNDGGIGSGDSGADGSAGEGGPINNGTVIITDASSTPKTLRVKTNATGYYIAKVTGFTAPLVVKIVSQSGKIYYSLREDAIAPGTIATVNITPLTDKVASLVAGTASLSTLTPADITAAKVASAKATVLATFSGALSAAGVTNTTAFDPIKTPFKPDGTGYDKVLDQVRHETNASGGTDLYPKTVAYAVDGTVASTPLTPSAPLALVVGGKELNFARLDSLRSRLNACFAQAEAARSYTTAGNACAGLAHPSFKSAGRDFVETVVQMSGRKDRNRVLEAADVMTGAQFDAPELLLLESSVSAASATSATVADLDSAIIELRWYQPANASYRSTAFLMRRFDNFNAAAAPAVQRSAIANADGTSSDWWFYGGQSNYSFGISPRMSRHTNLNPSTNGVTGTLAAPASPSIDTSSLGLFVGTQKFNTSTRAWEGNGVAYAKVKGPGLPISGVVISRIDSATSTGACIIPDDMNFAPNGAPIPTEALYMGYYSSNGLAPGGLVAVSRITTPSSYGGIFSSNSIEAAVAVGQTRTVGITVTAPSSSAETASFVLTLPNGSTVSKIVLVAPGSQVAPVASAPPPPPPAPVPPAPGSVAPVSVAPDSLGNVLVSFPQSTSTLGVVSFPATVSFSGGAVYTLTASLSPFTGSITNQFHLGRALPSGADYPYPSTVGVQFGPNNALAATDYSLIKPWSRYTIELYSVSGALVSTETDRIVTQPRRPQYLGTAPLHNLSANHAALTPVQAPAASFAMQWANNPAAPTPYQAGTFSFLFNTVSAPNSIRRNASALLKRPALSTSGDSAKTFTAADVSSFTGCRVPAGTSLVFDQHDSGRKLNAGPDSTEAVTYRNVFLQTSINRVRIRQTVGWDN